MSNVTLLAFTTIIIITNIIITITITITNIEGHLDICLGSCLVWPWGPFFCTKPMLNTLWQISLQTNVFLPVFCFAFSFRSAVWLHWRKSIFNRKEIFVLLHWRCQCISACLLWPSLIGQKKNAKRKCCTYLDIGLRPRLIRSHTLLGAELAMSLAFTITKLPIESL